MTSENLSITEEPDYRYGPQVRVIRNHEDEQKIEATNRDLDTLKAYQHTDRWALEAVLEAGYDVVYLHDGDKQIESWDDLVAAVEAEYGNAPPYSSSPRLLRKDE